MNMFRRLYLVSACITMLVGCDFVPQHTTKGGVDFPYGPETFQIHLLSRLESSPEGQVPGAIVCVEFDDRDGQATRATGLLEIKMTVPDQTGLERAFDLNNLEINKDVWNRTTRMYQVIIPFDPALKRVPDGGIPIQVIWTSIDGKPIMEQGILRALNLK